MSGAGLWAFLVNIIGIAIVVGLIFAAMEFRPLPEPFRKFARLAVGGAAALLVLVAIGAVLFGGAAAGQIKVTVIGIFEFAIGVIVLYAVLWLVDQILDYFAVPMADKIKFLLSVIALIVILTLAAAALTSGGLGFINTGGRGGLSFLPAQQQPSPVR
jgi:hypothetical protein